MTLPLAAFFLIPFAAWRGTSRARIFFDRPSLDRFVETEESGNAD